MSTGLTFGTISALFGLQNDILDQHPYSGHSDPSELWGRFLGDTADRISDPAHCSVLIVKQ
jgi:hypothetical protein